MQFSFIQKSRKFQNPGLLSYLGLDVRVCDILSYTTLPVPTLSLHDLSVFAQLCQYL